MKKTVEWSKATQSMIDKVFIRVGGFIIVGLLSIIGYLLNDMNEGLKNNRTKLEDITIEYKTYRVKSESDDKVIGLKFEDYGKRISNNEVQIGNIKDCLNKTFNH